MYIYSKTEIRKSADYVSNHTLETRKFSLKANKKVHPFRFYNICPHILITVKYLSVLQL